MIRPATTADFDAILEINREWVHYLAPMDLSRLELLAEMAAHLWVVEQLGKVVAFLLVFREGSDYDSLNYQWFSKNYEGFLYVDRIAIRRDCQGSGWGRRLYERLFELAENEDLECVCCEYNIQPMNEGSAAFHAEMGFMEVGQQKVESGKVVSLQSRPS